MTPAEWEAERQAEADAAGTLKLRSPMGMLSMSGNLTPPTHIVYLRGDKLIQIDQKTFKSAPFDPTIMHLPVSPDPDDPTRFLVERESLNTVIIADRITLRAMVREFENGTGPTGLGGVNENDAIVRRINYLSALPFSAFMPILTDYLQYRYWIPSHLNKESIASWVQLFPGSVALNQASIQVTFASLMTGERPVMLDNHAAVKSVGNDERFAITIAASLSIKGVGWAFAKAENLSASWAFITGADPALLERNILDGTVAELHPIGRPSGELASYTTSEPYKFKAGKKVMLFTLRGRNNPGLAGESVTGDSDYVGGTIRATTVSNKSPQFAAISFASHEKAPLYMLAQPFLTFGGSSSTERWTDRNLEDPNHPIPKRSVPLDVILAGAPAEATA